MVAPMSLGFTLASTFAIGSGVPDATKDGGNGATRNS